jgi:hypothetical protein
VESVRRAIAAARLRECLTVDARGRMRIDPVVADQSQANETIRQVQARARRATVVPARHHGTPPEQFSIFQLGGLVVLAVTESNDADHGTFIPMTTDTAAIVALKLFDILKRLYQNPTPQASPE